MLALSNISVGDVQVALGRLQDACSPLSATT
jgi:hypothetical protein